MRGKGSTIWRSAVDIEVSLKIPAIVRTLGDKEFERANVKGVLSERYLQLLSTAKVGGYLGQEKNYLASTAVIDSKWPRWGEHMGEKGSDKRTDLSDNRSGASTATLQHPVQSSAST